MSSIVCSQLGFLKYTVVQSGYVIPPFTFSTSRSIFRKLGTTFTEVHPENKPKGSGYRTDGKHRYEVVSQDREDVAILNDPELVMKFHKAYEIGRNSHLRRKRHIMEVERWNI